MDLVERPLWMILSPSEALETWRPLYGSSNVRSAGSVTARAGTACGTLWCVVEEKVAKKRRCERSGQALAIHVATLYWLKDHSPVAFCSSCSLRTCFWASASLSLSVSLSQLKSRARRASRLAGRNEYARPQNNLVRPPSSRMIWILACIVSRSDITQNPWLG